MSVLANDLLFPRTKEADRSEKGDQASTGKQNSTGGREDSRTFQIPSNPSLNPSILAQLALNPPRCPLESSTDPPPMAEKEKAAAEEEYVSDVDDSPLPALRREASDDDDDDGGGGRGLPPPSTVVGSDSDSDGQGAAEVYDEDEGSEKCEGMQEHFGAGRGGGGGGDAKEVPDEGKYEEEEAQAKGEAAVDDGEDKEKKGIDPYAVQRIGAFFMHDDRFHNKENDSRGRQREFFGGQKLRHPKDDSVWVHDRFDEINVHDVQHDNARRPTIPFRAWAGDRTHGVNHGYLQGTKSPSYYHGNRADYKYIPKKSLTRYESSNNYNRFPNEANTSYDNSKNYRSVPRKFHSYYDNKNFDNARREPRIHHVNAIGYAPNVYRGKPSRPYQPHWKNTFGNSSVQRNRTYSRSQNEEARSGAGEGKCYYQNSNLQNEQNIPLKEELPLIQRRKAQPAIFSKLFTTSVHMAHSSLKTQSRPVLGVKAFVPSGGHVNAVDSVSTVSIKGMPSLGSHSSVSTSNNYSQYSKSRDQGSGLNNGESAKSKFSSTSQATEFSDAVYQQRSVQQLQPRQRASTQIFHQNIASTNNIQSHPQATSTSSTEDAETSPPPGSKSSEAPSVVIGQNYKEEPVRASFPHDGGHVLGVTGARGLTLGDQGFPGTPAVLPAMQFSGQHPSGPDIPSIGMALPGLSLHQLGGNSEANQMTWLPTLSGAAGSFGETYHPCYLGTYYPQPSQLPSSSVSSRNHSVSDALVSLNSHERPEVVDQELHQRKNKPRRYSEMSFAS
ncbi:hypothetical protein ACQ4PT_040530 [Festuca glaucescens]